MFWYDPKEKNLLSGVEGLKNPGIDKMVEVIDQVIEISLEQNCKIIGSCTGNTIEEVLLICEKFKANPDNKMSVFLFGHLIFS